MKKYTVYFSRLVTEGASVDVFANSEEEAYEIGHEKIISGEVSTDIEDGDYGSWVSEIIEINGKSTL